MVVEEVASSDMRNLKPLPQPSRVNGVNLYSAQWDWLDEHARATKQSRSDLIRRAVDLLRDAVDQHGVDGPILGKV